MPVSRSKAQGFAGGAVGRIVHGSHARAPMQCAGRPELPRRHAFPHIAPAGSERTASLRAFSSDCLDLPCTYSHRCAPLRRLRTPVHVGVFVPQPGQEVCQSLCRARGSDCRGGAARTPRSLPPVPDASCWRAVETPVVDRLSEVVRLNGIAAGEVRNRACDFQDPCVGSGGQAQSDGRRGQQPLTIAVE